MFLFTPTTEKAHLADSLRGLVSHLSQKRQSICYPFFFSPHFFHILAFDTFLVEFCIRHNAAGKAEKSQKTSGHGAHNCCSAKSAKADARVPKRSHSSCCSWRWGRRTSRPFISASFRRKPSKRFVFTRTSLASFSVSPLTRQNSWRSSPALAPASPTLPKNCTKQGHEKGEGELLPEPPSLKRFVFATTTIENVTAALAFPCSPKNPFVPSVHFFSVENTI